MLEAFLIVLLCANTLFFGLLWWGQISWHNDYMRLLDVLDKRVPPITNVSNVAPPGERELSYRERIPDMLRDIERYRRSGI